MKFKFIKVSLLSIAMCVTAGAAIAESVPVPNARANMAELSPKSLRVVEDMESAEGRQYTDSEVTQVASQSEQFMFRITLLTVCQECYQNVVAVEKKDGKLWSIEQIRSHDWQWKNYAMKQSRLELLRDAYPANPTKENEAAYINTQRSIFTIAQIVSAEHGK